MTEKNISSLSRLLRLSMQISPENTAALSSTRQKKKKKIDYLWHATSNQPAAMFFDDPWPNLIEVSNHFTGDGESIASRRTFLNSLPPWFPNTRLTLMTSMAPPLRCLKYWSQNKPLENNLYYAKNLHNGFQARLTITEQPHEPWPGYRVNAR